MLIVTCANFHLKSGNFLHAVLLILCCHRTYIKVKYYAYKLWPSRISGLVPHAHNSIRYVGLTRTQLCMHAYYTACMYHGKKEGSKRRYIGIHFAICIQDLLGSSGKPPSITLSLPPSVEEDELALLDLFHQQPILLNPQPCTCSSHMHSGCGGGIVHQLQ